MTGRLFGGGGHLTDEALVRTMDHELDAAELTRTEVHLARCEPCRQRLVRFEDLAARVVQMRRGSGAREDASADRLRDRLSASMAARRTGSVGRERSRGGAGVWQWGHAALVGATLVALALGAHDGRRWTPGGAAVSSAEVVALPVPVLTPGAVDPITAEELCSGAPRPAPQVPVAVRQQVLRAYRAETVPADAYELDYLITPELGGAGDPRNLWPQPYASAVWNAYVKDELEELLPRLVCSGAVELADAQRDIAGNWIAAYKKYFKTDRPLPQQTVRRQEERNR